MTLLAFDLNEEKTKDFIGLSIECQPGTNPSYFLYNALSFETKYKEENKNAPASFPQTSDKAPFQKYRWLHVPGDMHQQLNNTFYGESTYNVTPRYRHQTNLVPLDKNLTT